ncbi:uncharacterized protein SEPMUDRAFT_149208 [Sphaerulina musiva SO2202]|uniref:Zn(2)-C6 fungal-type domain-containing protein n=1 Tax=Sphaerulina musiva (strain SO2202) TaxID=692275 RepID=M3D3U5_SPHMS|nr:uncharacterized protein SEPMUDRAFT_149208 [Sphaerulina musiva SO2202]EMF12574.1 hypothetical protein SEPMUDRAFT_149208 [Sphaerulina musiva SO2202]
MAITTLTPDSITFELNHERRQSISSYSHYSSYSSTTSSSPELSSPGCSPHQGRLTAATPRSVSCHHSPPVVPKVEELDEHVSPLAKVPEAAEDTKANAVAPGPRKRGRPRKHPLVEQKRSAHARSKTGCGTCRRRKKKCDETRPSCTNCEKNNVTCDGYEPKKPWRSGREKALVNRQPATIPVLPSILSGVETTIDFQFFQYFSEQLAAVLSLNVHNDNPFIKVIVPMAMYHEGLMSSLLYLSGSCLLANSSTKDPEMEQRVNYNSDKAVTSLTEDLKQMVIAGEQNDLTAATVGDPSIAQTLLLCLQTVCAGKLKGEWRSHMQSMKLLLSAKASSGVNEDFRRFVLEFLLYHDYSSSITSFVDPLDAYSAQLMEEFQAIKLPTLLAPESATLLGVMDGLFLYISQIRRLRDRIRVERLKGRDYNEKYTIAWHIHQELQAWTCQYDAKTPRYWASLLYRQCVFLYLHRTIMPSKSCVQFKQGVDDGLEYLRQLPRDHDDQGTQSILLLPLFILGCCAFEPEQRSEIAEAFVRLQRWSKLGNITYAKRVVEEVWVMMDTGRAEETWDWESIIYKHEWDFLIT